MLGYFYSRFLVFLSLILVKRSLSLFSNLQTMMCNKLLKNYNYMLHYIHIFTILMNNIINMLYYLLETIFNEIYNYK